MVSLFNGTQWINTLCIPKYGGNYLASTGKILVALKGTSLNCAEEWTGGITFHTLSHTDAKKSVCCA